MKNGKREEGGAAHGFTRRDFINGVLAGGAVFAFDPLNGLASAARGEAPQAGPAGIGTGAPIDKTYDFSQCHRIWNGELNALPEPEEHRYECIVVGGGMSGLVTAWKLNRLGVRDLLVLEKDERMGGLCCADTVDGVTGARASAYPSYPFNADMIELYEDLKFVRVDGTTKKVTVNPDHVLRPPYDQILMGGTWVVDPFERAGILRLPISQKAKDDLAALEKELLHLRKWHDAEGNAAFDCPVDDSSESRKIRALDDMTLGEYAVSKGWSVEMVKVFDPLLKSAYGLGHDRISAWAALDILTDELLPSDPGEPSIGFPGGNAFFADALVARLDQGRLRTKTMVTRIRRTRKEVRVGVIEDGRPKGYKARTVVFAAPQFMAPYLIDDLPGKRRKAARRFEDAAYVVANVEVSRTPAGLAYSNQLAGDFVMSDFIVADWTRHMDPLEAPAGRKNLLTAYCPMTAGDRTGMLEPSLDEWQSRIVGELERALPGVRGTVTGFHLYRWGHAFSVPGKGWVFSEERKLARKPLGRIFFAHADVEGIPTIDHAMASGFRAAGEVAGFLE